MRSRLFGVLAVLAMVVASCSSGSQTTAGPHEGIGVQGAWTIDIVNPDGSVAKRVQFHNQFIGQEHLASILAMEDTHEGWQIGLTSGADAPLCGGNGVCFGSATAARDASTNELVLEASIAPEFESNIAVVLAFVDMTTTGLREFSQKSFILEPKIPVGAGQTVLVEIRYSFATMP